MDNSFLHRKKLLLVDDEPDLLKMVSDILSDAGFETVLTAATVKEAIITAEKEKPDLMVLDVMLPDGDGFSLMKQLRTFTNVPIIFLTAKDEAADKLAGLGLGADDYITKPFSLKNLYARIQAVWRRSDHDLKPLAEKFSWNAGDLVIDYNRKEVLKKGETISLTPIEWKILSAFTRYPQKVFTRDELIASAFDTDFSGYDRVIDTHIKNLRKKIEDDPKNPIYLCTVHGIGYKFGGNI